MKREEVQGALAELVRLLRPRLFRIVAFSIVVTSLVLGIAMLTPDRFTATATFAAPKQSDMLLWVVSGEEMVQKISQDFDLRERYKARTMQQLKRHWERHIMARKTREGMLTISVTDRDPAFAAKLANALAVEAQQSIIRRRLSDSSRSLADRSILLEQARAQQERWEKASTVPTQIALVGSLPALERYALEGVARSQAETAAATQRAPEEGNRAGLAMLNQEMVRLQSQLLALGRDAKVSQKALSPEMAGALDILQRHVYWQTLVDIMGRDVVRLKDLALMDIPLEPAVAPEVRSGPDRVYVVILAFVLSLILATVAALGIAVWKQGGLDRPTSA